MSMIEKSSTEHPDKGELITSFKGAKNGKSYHGYPNKKAHVNASVQHPETLFSSNLKEAIQG